jgi:uncharacterized protein GlcG (DUF336 family)
MNGYAVDLDTAQAIIAQARRRGREAECAPLTLAVLDPGGHLVAFAREDSSGIVRPQIAVGKAWGALGMGFGSRELARRAQGNPSFVNSLTALAPGGLVPVPGGVLIRGNDGQVLGAIGISGDTSDRDEMCAIDGIESVGLVPDAG